MKLSLTNPNIPYIGNQQSTITGSGGPPAYEVNFNNVTGSGPTYSTIRASRVSFSGTTLSATPAISAEWGNRATAVYSGGGSQNDARGQLTITANGMGITANPTFTFTFVDGAWDTIPYPAAWMTGGTGTLAFITVTNVSTTAVTFQYNGTPTSGSTYVITWHVPG
jgi:hypothetical protein